MIARLASLPLAVSVSLALAACARVPPPPRPVPPVEHRPALPSWFPEQPWTEAAAASRLFIEGKIVFDSGKATIRPESESVLHQLLEYLQANPDITRVRIEGHTDARASEEYNQGLSERRALAVAEWLVDHGLDHQRVLAVAFGETRPLWPNDTREGRQENRRVEFHVAELGGNRFRGEDPTAGGMVLLVRSKEQREAAKRAATVPTAEPPPVIVERDVIKAIEKPPLRDVLEQEPPADG